MNVDLQPVAGRSIQELGQELIGRAAFSPPGRGDNSNACSSQLPHLPFEGFGVIGGVATRLRVEIGANVFTTGEPSPTFIGNLVIPVVIGAVDGRISIPPVIKGHHPSRDLAFFGWLTESTCNRHNSKRDADGRPDGPPSPLFMHRPLPSLPI